MPRVKKEIIKMSKSAEDMHYQAASANVLTLLIELRAHCVVGVHKYSSLPLYEWLTYSISAPWHAQCKLYTFKRLLSIVQVQTY